MDRHTNRTDIKVIHHFKNKSDITANQILSIPLTNILIEKIGLNRLVSIYVPSFNKQMNS